VTDLPLVKKRLAIIDGCLADLRSIVDLAQIATDVRTERFAEHTLQLAIQAALDIAAHIVSDDHLGEPTSNRDLFAILGRHAWIPPELVAPLSDMASFRNVLVHGYADVDVGIVKEAVEFHLDELDRFVAAIRARLPR
jgi:uncharacterized protein YutE (UPF0331/DUF86 family)